MRLPKPPEPGEGRHAHRTGLHPRRSVGGRAAPVATRRWTAAVAVQRGARPRPRPDGGGRTKRWQAAAVELRLRPVGQPIRSGAHRLGPWGAPIGSAALSPRAAGPSPPEASLQEALSALRLRTRSTTRSTPWHTPCRPGCRPSRHGSATTHPIDPSRPPSGQHHARYGRGAMAAPRPILLTPPGPRQVSIMLDTGAFHCFMCAQLALLLHLPVPLAQGPVPG